MKKTIYKITAIILFMFLIGCEDANDISEDINQENKSLTLLFSFPSSTIDPHQDWMGVRAGIAETLVKIDQDLSIQPWLAENWEQEDEQTWRFTLREGLTFHDDTPVDGNAVKASFERLLEVNEAMANNLKIESIETDGQDILFVTSESYPTFVSELVHTNTSIIKVDTENINEQPIGTGPFQVVDFIAESKIELERYADYWDGASLIDEVTIQFNSDGNVRGLALQSGEADIAYHLPPETLAPIEQRDDLRVESVSSLRVHFLLYNMKSSALQDRNVRKALDLLIDRQIIADEIMAGHATAANGPFHPDFSFSNDGSPESYDPAKAESLLEQAGYQKNADGQLEKDNEVLELTLATYQGRPELPQMAQYLQAEASKLGMEINIVTVENVDAYLWEQQTEWDLVTYSMLSAPRGDGGYFLNVAFSPDGSLNPGSIYIEDVNALITQLNQTSTIEERIQLQKQMVDIIQEEVPQSYIVYPHIIVGVNNRVKNWTPGSEEYYLITNELDLE